MIEARVICWNTIACPGPRLDEHVNFDRVPCVGEQLEGVPRSGFVLYVRKVRWIVAVGKAKAVVEVSEEKS